MLALMLSRLFGSTPSGSGITEPPAPTKAPFSPMHTARPTTIARAFFNPGLMVRIIGMEVARRHRGAFRTRPENAARPPPGRPCDEEIRRSTNSGVRFRDGD
jgi:hypothetical protein